MRSSFFALALLLGCSSEPFDVAPDQVDSGSDSAVAADSATSTDSSTPDTSTPDTSTPPSDSTAPDTGAAADSAVLDSMLVDTAKPDTAVVPDATGIGCLEASDCKLFSSYCATAACKCIALHKTEPSPKCDGAMVTCFVDPCSGKTAVCSGGTCAVKM